MRQIVLDTETTGLDPSQGHRIIEIGCLEMINRRITENTWHQYINPEREIDQGAYEVHGIGNEFLSDKPRFKEVIEDFLGFIKGAELIIHNAPFDVGFLNAELDRAGSQWGCIEDCCEIIDTLVLAREVHPGKKNNLDALCKRYEVNNSKRELHGALLDAELLADVYLKMTGGQASLLPERSDSSSISGRNNKIKRLDSKRSPLKVIRASDEELVLHNNVIAEIGGDIW